jgi:hypothetical protein
LLIEIKDLPLHFPKQLTSSAVKYSEEFEDRKEALTNKELHPVPQRAQKREIDNSLVDMPSKL